MAVTTRKISGDQLPLKWEVRGREIRLHTPEGGVVTGSGEGFAIHLRLPGLPPTTFQRLSRCFRTTKDDVGRSSL
jgi:hypothetical protein